jgi:hypothetical protein
MSSQYIQPIAMVSFYPVRLKHDPGACFPVANILFKIELDGVLGVKTKLLL